MTKVLTAIFMICAAPLSSNAADLNFLCAGALQSTMNELIPQFERSAGHKILVSYANVGVLNDRFRKGEAADVVILSRAQITDLIKDGKIIDSTQSGIGKVGIGVFVRKGATKPDISSPAALTQSMIAAKAIAFNAPAT